MRVVNCLYLTVVLVGCSTHVSEPNGQLPLEEPVWLRTGGVDQGLGLAEAIDGTLVIVGRTDGDLGQGDAFVLKTSLDGEVEWQKTLGSNGVDVLLDVGVHENGSIFAGGVSTGNYEGEQNELFSDGALSALSASGEVLWSQLVGLGAINQLVVVRDGLVVTGSGIQSERQDADAFVAKYNLSGERLWQLWLRSDGNDSATGITAIDGQLWVVGFTDGALFSNETASNLRGWIALIDNDGALVRGNELEGEEEQSLTRVCGTPNGDIAVAGYVIDENGGIDSIVKRYDASHSELNTWRSGWQGSDAVYGLACERNGSIALSGRLDVAEDADGFWLRLRSDLSVQDENLASYSGRDEWVDVIEVEGGLCFSGYRPFDDNPDIDDLDAVAECN
jgi:hypothetical protein